MRLLKRIEGHWTWLVPAATIFAVLAAVLPKSSARQLDREIETWLNTSLPRMARNLSVDSPGSVIASPESDWPNYRFHWVRDSAIVVRTLTDLLAVTENSKARDCISSLVVNFGRYSAALQTLSGVREGEVRFLPDGSADSSPWPRPQFDGPALRALALMEFLESHGRWTPPGDAKVLQNVIRRDLDVVARHHATPGFDLWEYALGQHFYTRMVQTAALLKAGDLFAEEANLKWRSVAEELKARLNEHWDPAQAVILFHQGEVRDDKGEVIAGRETFFDTSVALAVNHAGISGGDFGPMDSRVWSTLAQLEVQFRNGFPFNQLHADAAAIGRHIGDDYFGGNAFYFLTAAYAERMFVLARLVSLPGSGFSADDLRRAELELALRRKLSPNEKFNLPHAELSAAFLRRGESFLRLMLRTIPSDGSMAEQFSKVDGKPASARDLTWSYSSLLSAILKRESVRRTTVHFAGEWERSFCEAARRGT